MLSDSELEALIHGSVPRELPASLRQSLSRVLVPPPVRTTVPMWTAIALLLLSSLIIWLASTNHSRSYPGEKPTTPGENAASSAPAEIKPTAQPVRLPSGGVPFDDILTSPQFTGKAPADNHAMISSSHLFRDTIPLPLRLQVERHESKALVFLP